MKTRTKTLLTALATCTAVAAGVAGSASGATYVYEPFDYADTGTSTDGAYLGDGNQSGALGMTGSWAGTFSTNELDISSPGLTFSHGVNNLPVAGNYAYRQSRSGATNAYSSVSAGATSALTADNSTMWMSFLFVDQGFSGPTSQIIFSSEPSQASDGAGLESAGYGVGVAIRATVNPARAPHTVYYNGTTGATRVAGPDTFLSSGGPEGTVFMYAIKVNWKEDGTPDELFLFEIDDLTTEPNEGDAIASDSFDMLLANQQTLDLIALTETQNDGFDEIRLGTSFADVVATNPIPEPSSLALLGLGGLCLINRRHRG